MRAVIQQYNQGEPEVRDVPPPALRPGGVLVRNEASLISPGTERLMVELAGKSLLGKARQRPDLVRKVVDKIRKDGVLEAADTVRRRLDRPVPLGYSCAGRVLEADRGVDDLGPADRVACAGAGYASHSEVVFVPRLLAAPIPEGVSSEAAAFTTLGAVALQGLRLAGAELGETVAIIGLGLVGQLAAQLARAAGCRVVGMDTDGERCLLARRLGAEAAASESAEFLDACRRATAGRGVDRVVVAAATSSSEPLTVAGEAARDRATVVLVGAVGTEVPRRIFYEKELTLRVSRSYGPGRYDPSYEEKGRDYPIGYVRWTENRNMEAFLGLLARGAVEVEPLISHRFDIEEAGAAYALISGRQAQPSLGIVLTYPEARAAAGAERPAPGREADPIAGRSTPAAAAGGADPASRPGEAIGLGLLGAGQFARGVLLPALRRVAGFERRVVCAAGGASAQHAAGKFGFRRATTSEREVLEDPRVAAVAIATRHDLHARQVIAALEAGKHVFVEKPLCLDEAELEAIEAAYERAARGRSAPLVLMVGYNRRFAPMARRLGEFLAPIQEPLVMHYRVNAGPVAPDHWVHDPAVGGGRIVGEVCHFVDFLTYLAGGPPIGVRASGLPGAAGSSRENLTATLEFAGGSLGTVTYVAVGAPALAKERLEVFGGGCAAILDNFRRLELLGNGRRSTSRARLRLDKGHRGELDAFRAAIAGAAGCPIPLEEIFATSRATFEIHRSLAGS